ncbi:pLS20_p028 family conjugation system transmembrane protein [Bacillus sp. BP-3]|uniref:pLS20_p028 family conjugation system transmembrane protein n=1 Tax=Bacillus sp. BP-3 TaxID=3022773 RepID=UPI00232E2BA6|nr:hypothetical protein [Bacillus sp. BP-3]MDC2867805.1 hypothetical protein [Bacillus sp. BP-3]
MNDEKILEILKMFDDYLEIGGFINYILRSIGWMIILGLSYLVDALEGITDQILLVKTLFASEGVQNFVKDFQPILYILFAFSFVYIGYTLIFNRKTNREQIAVNIFISMGIIVLLSAAMMQADKFTDQAIKAVDLKGSGSTSEKIIKDGITDVAQFDIEGWKTTTLKDSNKITQENIRRIDIVEKMDKDFTVSKDKKLTEKGQKVLEKKLTIAPDGTEKLVDLKNGWFDFWPDKYYRWHWKFWNIAASLLVIGMTLLFTAIKLGKLCFELAFNYILANLVAPADIANGQKTKHILLNILNTFLIMIMIFISLKLYLMGMNFIHDKLSGVAYVLALICLSLAVIDGPVICERIFGIDAGLKNGWSVLAGGYALGKGLSRATSGVAKKAGNMLKGAGKGGLLAGASVAGIGNGYRSAGEINGSEQKDEKQGIDQQGNRQGLEQGKGGADGEAQEGANGTGNSSLQNEMEQSGSNVGGNQASQGEAGNGALSLHDEMKASGFNKGAGAQGMQSALGATSKAGTVEKPGTAGVTSTSGTSGIASQAGTTGITSTSGTSGMSSQAGTVGATSTSGTSGIPSEARTTGITSTSGISDITSQAGAEVASTSDASGIPSEARATGVGVTGVPGSSSEARATGVGVTSTPSSSSAPSPSSVTGEARTTGITSTPSSSSAPIPSSIASEPGTTGIASTPSSSSAPIPSSIASEPGTTGIASTPSSSSAPISSSIASEPRTTGIASTPSSSSAPIPSSIASEARTTGIASTPSSSSAPIPSSIASEPGTTGIASTPSSSSAPIPSSIASEARTTGIASTPSSSSAPIPSSIASEPGTTGIASTPSSSSAPIPSSIASEARTTGIASMPSSSSAPRTPEVTSSPSVTQTFNSGGSTTYQNPSASVDSAPSSTSDIPAPQRENRTLGQYAKEQITNKWNSSKIVQQTKRSYELGKNTGESWRKKRENKE